MNPELRRRVRLVVRQGELIKGRCLGTRVGREGTEHAVSENGLSGADLLDCRWGEGGEACVQQLQRVCLCG